MAYIYYSLSKSYQFDRMIFTRRVISPPPPPPAPFLKANLTIGKNKIKETIIIRGFDNEHLYLYLYYIYMAILNRFDK